MINISRQIGSLLRRNSRELHWYLLNYFLKTTTLDTRQGRLTIRLNQNEPIGRSLFFEGQFELDFMTAVLRHLRELGLCPPKGQGVLLDIGANNGVIGIGALYNGEFEKAICVEPEPGNFSILHENVQQNGFEDRIICLQCAVSDINSEVDFELCDSNFGDHRVRVRDIPESMQDRYSESARSVIKVLARPVDEILQDQCVLGLNHPSLMWIDVQGFEGIAFRGAHHLLSTKIPVVAELWPYGLERAGMSQADYFSIVKQYWDSYWVLRGDHFVRYAIEDLGYIFDELGNKGGCVNVIFTTL